MLWIIDTFVTFMRIVLTLTKPISDKILDILCFVRFGRAESLPPIKNEILLMSATELAEKIRKRQLTSLEVVSAYIKRIEEVQPIINAYIDHRFEEAVADAEAVDKMIESGTKSEDELARSTPLLGVPFTCKESVGVKGLTQACGLKSLKGRKASFDSAAAERYRRAGAIPVVVTNIPTLELWFDTMNPLYGRTKNPYNTNRSPGGSSGGEGSLIGSAGAVIGIGTDLGGSIRIPSSFCGIYGHKGTKRIISNEGPWPREPESINDFVSTGPMCRYVQDLNPLVKILLKDDVTDIPLDKEIDFRKVKILYMEELPGVLLRSTDEIKAAVRKAVTHFEVKHGVQAVKLNLPEMRHAFAIWQSKFYEKFGDMLNRDMLKIKGDCGLVWEFLKYLMGFSDYNHRMLYFASIETRKESKFYRKCLKQYDDIRQTLEEVLEGDAVLILPTHPEPAVHPIATIPKFRNVSYTMLFNALGYPATQIPAGLHKGLPVGLQVVATSRKDHLTLAFAKELDSVFGGWKSPSPVVL